MVIVSDHMIVLLASVVAYWIRKYLEASNNVCGYALSSNLAGTFSIQ